MSRIEQETGIYTPEAPKVYIGDGVYAVCDGFSIVLATDRDSGLHWIALEPSHIAQLNRFAQECRQLPKPPLRHDEEK